MAVDKSKLQEEASITRFCKVILGWDCFRLLKQSSVYLLLSLRYYMLCDFSVRLTVFWCTFSLRFWKQNFKDAASDLKEVKDTYNDVDEYLATFEPLLFEEVKAQILQLKNGEEEAGMVSMFSFWENLWNKKLVPNSSLGEILRFLGCFMLLLYHCNQTEFGLIY